jgi:hypothetical protein
MIFLRYKNAQGFYNAGVVAVNSKVVGLASGANPTIGSYKASAVKIYNATTSYGSAFCKQKSIGICFEKTL